MLKVVIPKGSLEEQTLRLLEAADLTVRRGSNRDYHGSIDDDRIERVSLLRPQEIPTYVQDGLFDLGITGAGLDRRDRAPTSRSSRRCRTRRAAPDTGRGSCWRCRTSTWRTALARSRPARASPPSSCT